MYNFRRKIKINKTIWAFLEKFDHIQTISGGCPPAEVKLPDGQRLAYRMDYVLKESGNTYISAITSHTAYWCNPDMAFFMLTKIHPELDKVVAEKKHQIPVATAQQYPTVSISQCHTPQYTSR